MYFFTYAQVEENGFVR